MSDAKPASRRRHDTELKRQVIAACTAPGASVAQVAMSYGLNANLVHKWRRLAGHDGEPAGSPAFVPVSVVTKAPQCEPPQSIELELQRGPVHVRVRWPMAGAASCAKLNRLAPYAYLRDVLERLPTHPASRIDELLPHRWTVPTISSAPCGTGSK